jgi:hypothetical protein
MRYLTLAAALCGAADAGQFLVARRHLFRENRRRAVGTAAGVALWSGLGLSAALDERSGRRTLALASAVGAANAALLGLHLRRRPFSSRVLLGPALAAVALGSALPGALQD